VFIIIITAATTAVNIIIVC